VSYVPLAPFTGAFAYAMRKQLIRVRQFRDAARKTAQRRE
jgi:hypothetical protein